jgi:biopolymer transport protein ExbD
MAFNPSYDSEPDDLLATINTTPLVDVMLVLLIIFLITIPVVTHTVAVVLPKERNQPMESKLEDVNIAVTVDGRVYWNAQAVASEDELQARLARLAQAAGEHQPVVHVRGDADSSYERVGLVVLACQRAGIVKIGFVTEPPPQG